MKPVELLDYIRTKIVDIKDINQAVKTAFKLAFKYDSIEPVLPLEPFAINVHTRLHVIGLEYNESKAISKIESQLSLKILSDLALNGDATRLEIIRSIQVNLGDQYAKTTVLEHLDRLERYGWVKKYKVFRGLVGANPIFYYYCGSGKQFSVRYKKQSLSFV